MSTNRLKIVCISYSHIVLIVHNVHRLRTHTHLLTQSLACSLARSAFQFSIEYVKMFLVCLNIVNCYCVGECVCACVYFKMCVFFCFLKKKILLHSSEFSSFSQKTNNNFLFIHFNLMAASGFFSFSFFLSGHTHVYIPVCKHPSIE